MIFKLDVKKLNIFSKIRHEKNYVTIFNHKSTRRTHKALFKCSDNRECVKPVFIG